MSMDNSVSNSKYTALSYYWWEFTDDALKTILQNQKAPTISQ